MSRRVLFFIGLAGLFLFIFLGSRMFVLYKNRWGKKLFLRKDVYEAFLRQKAALAAQGLDVEMTDAWRGELEQTEALAAGNSRAAFGLSPHSYAVAFDLVLVRDGTPTWNPGDAVWLEIGKAGEAQGLTWGLDWNRNGIPDPRDAAASSSWIHDAPHFELTGWKDEKAGGALALLKEAPPAVEV